MRLTCFRLLVYNTPIWDVINMIIETERLILRETSMDDFLGLYEILSDPETMKHYPKPYDKTLVEGWINWCMWSYKEYGFGLWAVILKNTNEYIGDCGLSMQIIDNKELPEIGYHINKKYQHMGYASEAARAVKDYIFNNLKYDEIYTYMKYTNSNSYFAAIKNDMSLHHEYPDEKNEISKAYSITRKTWLAYKNANKEYIVRKALLKDIENINSLCNIDSNLLIKSIHNGYCNICYIKNELAGVLLYEKKEKRILSIAINNKYKDYNIDELLKSVVLSDMEG